MEANGAFSKIVQREKEIADTRQRFLASILSTVAAGTVFEGQAVYQQKFGDPQNTQKIRITFKSVSPDGEAVSVMISNPDDNMDWVPAQGTINTDPTVDTETPDTDPTKQFHLSHPIELETDREKASRRDQMRSWQYYTQNGFRFWLGVKDGRLVGNGGFGLERRDYDIEAYKK